MGGLLVALLAASPAWAERGRDAVWFDSGPKQAAPAEASPVMPLRLQHVRLRPYDPARPTFNLSGARGLLLAQRPPAGGRGVSLSQAPVFRPLEETGVQGEGEEAVPAVDDLGMEDLEAGIDENGDVDPLESINRPIFEANLFLDRWVLRPVTRVYIETVPEPGRQGVSNFLQNLRTPVILINDLLQGELSRAGATFGRFFVNTFFGLGGLVDTADALDLPGHEEDFGQTLGAYGVGDKPYLMLPLIGPSNPRDLVGRVGDILMDPLSYLTPDELSQFETGINVVNDRALVIDDTDTLEATSIDYYAAVRSFYLQNRAFEVSNGRAPAPAQQELDEQEDLYDGLEEEDLDSLEQDLELQ